MGGCDSRAGPESPLGDQTGSGQLGMKISKILRDSTSKEKQMFGARGGGVFERVTRAGSPPASQRPINSFRPDRASPKDPRSGGYALRRTRQKELSTLGFYPDKLPSGV